jgi:uncharacterized protein YhjY with autotransporter beta-barrel domain
MCGGQRNFVAAVAGVLVCLWSWPAGAQDGFWHGVQSGQWHDAGNWFDQAPQNGNPVNTPTGVAIFAPNAQRLAIQIGDNPNAVDTNIGTLIFRPNTEQYNFRVDTIFSINGQGIVNGSDFRSRFTVTEKGSMRFRAGASAGTADYMVERGGSLNFLDASDAGNARINNSGRLQFQDQGNGGSADIVNTRTGDFSILGLENERTRTFTAGSIENAGAINMNFFAVTTVNLERHLLLSPTSMLFFKMSDAGVTRINAGTTAALDGSLRFTVLPANYTPGNFFILVRGRDGLTGKFSDVSFDSTLGQAIAPRLDYTANEAILFLDPNPQAGHGHAGSQHAAFGASKAFGSNLSVRNDGMLAVDLGVNPDPSRFAPEPRRPAVFKAMPSLAHTAPAAYWQVWGAGFGARQSIDAAGATPGVSSDVWGGAIGVDYRIFNETLVGVAAGASEASFSIPARTTTGRLDGGHVGIYGAHRMGPWYVSGFLSYSRFDNRITRNDPTIGQAAIGEFSSDLFGGRLEAGYRRAMQGVIVTPFAAIEASELSQRGYTETTNIAGLAPGIGLTFGSTTSSSVTTALGVKVEKPVVTPQGWVWLPHARAAWLHEFNPTRDAVLLTNYATFGVNGPRAASDAIQLDAGSRLAVSQHLGVFGSVTGEFSDRGHNTAGRGGVRVTW